MIAVALAVSAAAIAQESPQGATQGSADTRSEKPVIGAVQVVGGRTITADTVEFYLGIAEGDPWDPDTVRRNFHRFWESGLVEDLRVDEEPMGPGKVKVIVTVKERPKIAEYKFEGNKKLSNSTLKEKLETAGFSLRRDVPLRTSEIQRMRQTIQEAYENEGYASAKVETKITETPTGQRDVHFVIDEGVKIRIGDIEFEGNKVFSDRRLRMSMKKLKERSWFRWFGKKLIWNKEMWGEDSENLKKFYMNHGYKDIVVGEPQVQLVARNPEGETQKDKKFRMVVKIPVEEGRQFKLGQLKLEGSKVIATDRLRKLYEVEPGKTYNYQRIEDGNEAVRTLYQSRGYIYAYTNQVLNDEPDHPDTVDVTVQVFEGDRFRLGRLEFTGNTKTQDKVIRRQFRLDEGDWMDMTTFRRSVFKVNQLGYFKLTEDPLKLDFDDQNKRVNVTVKGQEVGRTDIQFGAGYSELDRFFVQFMFNTRNFLGRGETLGLAVSTGARADTYSLSFAEPYFLDKRQSIGGSVYKQNYTLTDYERYGKGGTLFWGSALGDFGQFSVTYGYEDVLANYVSLRQGYAGQDPKNPHRPPLPPPYTDIPVPDLFKVRYTGKTSSITPALFYDSRDDPFDPNTGMSTFLRLRYAGGALGGDFNYFRPEAGFTIFHPLTRRYILAGNIEGGIIKPFNGGQIPVYDRYRLGGERSLRGLPFYQVLPRKKNGDYFLDPYGARLGGDRYLQMNLEYQIKLGGPLKFILFSDTGNTWYETQGWDLSLLRYTAGAELRIFLPIFQAPLRFIYGVNLKPFPDEKKTDFQFSIGTTF